MEVLILILLRIAPIFLVMLVGFAAFRLGWVDTAFIGSANRIVYRIALPALIVLSISRASFGDGFPWRGIVSFAAALLASVWAGYLIAGFLGLSRERRAAFVQGGLRGNFAIIGLAIIEQVLGVEWIPAGAVLMAFFLPLHNLVGISVLSSVKIDNTEAFSRRLVRILRLSLLNPLMISIYLGALISVSRITIPGVAADALNYLSRLALPLALVGIGGSIGTYHAGGHFGTAAVGSLVKLILMPLIAVAVGLSLGLGGEILVILAIFAGAPAAVASYSMADAMGADRDTAGSIVLVSTALCFLSLTLILTLLDLLFA